MNDDRGTFLREVNRSSAQRVQDCYHCHTCTAGCPLADEMEFGPDRLLRLVQLGDRARTLAARDYWLCAGCDLCGARCPNGIDVPRVMDALRVMSLANGHAPPEPAIVLFHRLFAGVVRVFGRSHEASLLGLYKLRRLEPFSDLGSGLGLILRGKIPLVPGRTGAAADVRRIFAAASAADQDPAHSRGRDLHPGWVAGRAQHPERAADSEQHPEHSADYEQQPEARHTSGAPHSKDAG